MSKYKVLFHKKVMADLAQIELYYSQISTTITDQFFQSFFVTLDIVEQRPDLFQERYRTIRIANLHTFPYGIHYKITDDEIIILRILHFKQYHR